MRSPHNLCQTVQGNTEKSNELNSPVNTTLIKKISFTQKTCSFFKNHSNSIIIENFQVRTIKYTFHAFHIYSTYSSNKKDTEKSS